MRTRFSMLLALLCLLPALVMASTPRGYKTVPTGYNLFEIIYANSRGDADTDSPLPGSMLSIDRHTTILRYVHLYNSQLPQSALKGQTPITALKDWQR